jgi:hypothetical protein
MFGLMADEKFSWADFVYFLHIKKEGLKFWSPRTIPCKYIVVYFNALATYLGWKEGE